ncbi:MULTISPECIES: VOC family protein [Brevibacterium]|uniref:VOC family protein n=1 Tax=Brevibacterium TaxID=1696 RepID=UPI00142FE799|nr:VOC family protein [Brevibacterium sp. LS14]
MDDQSTPPVTGLHHLSLTVTDLDRSLEWYQRVLGWERQPGTFPHYDRESTGYGVLLADPASGMIIGLHTNTANEGETFEESRTGLDHVSLQVEDRATLENWVEWLDELGIAHTGIRDLTEPFSYSTVVFRDPDNVQLEFVAVG